MAQEGQLYSANGETESERSAGARGLKRDLLTHSRADPSPPVAEGASAACWGVQKVRLSQGAGHARPPRHSAPRGDAIHQPHSLKPACHGRGAV